jgi:RNA polymerase nonessential primary-like sigma factor
MADAVKVPEKGSRPAEVATNTHSTRLVTKQPVNGVSIGVVQESGGGETNSELPSLVARYFSDAGRYPLLTHAQERKLSTRLARALAAIASARGLADNTPLTLREVTGSLHGDELPTLRLQRFLRIANACRDQLIRSNLRLAVHIARRHASQGPLLTDLIQDGNIGLIKAVERFDPDRGFRFSTYAYWWITEEVKRCVKRGRRVVRTPEHVVDEIVALRSARTRLFNHLGRQPGDQELADTLDISIDRVGALTRYASAEVSTDTPITPDSDIALGDALSDEAENDPEASLAVRDRRRMVDDILSRLNERERDILLRRFGLGRADPETLQVISEKLAISRERVRQIEKGALAKLREQYASLSDLAGM